MDGSYKPTKKEDEYCTFSFSMPWNRAGISVRHWPTFTRAEVRILRDIFQIVYLCVKLLCFSFLLLPDSVNSSDVRPHCPFKRFLRIFETLSFCFFSTHSHAYERGRGASRGLVSLFVIVTKKVKRGGQYPLPLLTSIWITLWKQKP